MTLDQRIEALERELTAVIDKSKALACLSELDWCEVIASACDLIKTGKEMRIEELKAEEDD
jgi:hypothetical protein